MLLTLADRASDALVGVVTALGRLEPVSNLTGVFILHSLLSCDTGRSVVASSPITLFIRFSGEDSSSLSCLPVFKDLVDFDFVKVLGVLLSKPAFDELRFRFGVSVLILPFQADAWFAMESIF